ncbi:hypothetical protein E1293_31700 [Actinomadura darangshiensis]|uniref:NurA domain-containing protein n=1 Tax=Actinomadura darangshiensis TaxID=705336 RepID=A0A4R5AKD9_9ACTN|nr:DNA double-strand break repair nuclease NurA [Actinomadura darangshiensis]TDD73338.1 hypothetical protein E1293_31700 [Actinomadura darangshiensis]
MTTAPSQAATITIDPWDPGYATSVTADAVAELDASSVKLDLGVELPAERWRPITPPPREAPPGGLIVADGVRRIEARVWAGDPSGGMPVPGIAASCAAGLVRCVPGGPAALADWEVSRSLFTPSPAAADLVTRAGTYTAVRAPGGTAEQLSLALQRRLSDLEVTLATRYRSAAAQDDLLIVDGPLRGRAHLPRTVGYVKTHHAAYLKDAQAAVLAGLKPGQRTPVFLMTTSWERHSWYLRLPTPSTAPWAGIARCEATADLSRKEAADLADQCAAVIPGLAGVGYKDPRAPQNLVPIGGLEKLLRHRLGDAGILYRALRTAARGA